MITTSTLVVGQYGTEGRSVSIQEVHLLCLTVVTLKPLAAQQRLESGLRLKDDWGAVKEVTAMKVKIVHV